MLIARALSLVRRGALDFALREDQIVAVVIATTKAAISEELLRLDCEGGGPSGRKFQSRSRFKGVPADRCQRSCIGRWFVF